jgi:hypothetical protein
MLVVLLRLQYSVSYDDDDDDDGGGFGKGVMERDTYGTLAKVDT